jgi:hypothetical protein
MAVLLLVTMISIVTGCGRSSASSGTALATLGGVSIGDKPQPPGSEAGLLYVLLVNRSHAAVTIRSIRIAGPGIGTVVRVVQVRIAPLTTGGQHDKVLFDSVPSSLYGSDPPVNQYGKGVPCHKQALDPVRGFVLPPRAAAHVWTVIRAARPGTWKIPDNVVTYSQSGNLYRQKITMAAYGSVAIGAPDYVLEPVVRECLSRTGAKVLPGYKIR